MRFIIPPTYLRLLLLFCIYTSTQNFHAQEQEVDSLAKYTYQQLDKLYLKHLYEESNRSRTYADRLFANAQKKNDSLELFHAYRRYAILENNKGNYQKAAEYINTAKNIATEKLKNQNLEALSIFLKGKFSYDYGKYEEAFEYYKEAFTFYKENNKYMSYLTSHNIALIKNILGDQKGALKILLKNYKKYNTSSTEQKKKLFGNFDNINTLIAISDTYTKYGNNNATLKSSLLDSAEVYNNLGLKEAKLINDDIGYTYLLSEKGIISYERGYYEKAISELTLAKSKAVEQENKAVLPSIYYYTGMSYKNLDKEDNAIKFLQKTDSISKKNAINYLLLDRTYYILTDLFSKKGDGKSTFKYWELYKENKKINDHVSKSVKNAIHDHDIEKLEDQITKLIADKEEKENDYTTSLFIIVILIFLFLLFLVYNKSKQRQNQAKFNILLKALEEKKEPIPVIKEKTKSSLTIDEEKVQQILSALDKFEEKKLFLDVNCDLAFVAKKVKTNKAYLSKVIHSEKQQKFIKYITDLRINYALEKLKEDKLFRSYDIKSIASELGFKSPDSFSRAFKNKTDLYPSYYIKNINKIKDSETI